ncbi:MAG TPA: fatty acid desaturase [Candidatus Binatia bacterium]|jgi:fatty acid desaturase|nr:fatty acid desaturase [Candidatus Binatia bacterium]
MEGVSEISSDHPGRYQGAIPAFLAEDFSRVVRPSLPRHLYEPSTPHVIALVLHAAGLFVGCGLLASHVAGMDAPLVLRIVGVAMLVLGAAHGAHMLGFLGHEGIHLNLHRDKYVSVVIGTFLSAMTSFSAVGYGIAHWNHHRFTNQASDPDAHIYPRFRTFWRRFFLARLTGNRSHQQNLARMALGKPLALGYKLPFSPQAQRVLACMNLAMLVFWIGAYIAIGLWSPRTALFAIVLPLLLLMPMSGLRGYLEHASTGIGPFRDTRSYIHPLYTALFFGNNFHLEHHLYPGIPCYRLPAVHRLLRDGGYFERCQSHVAPTVMGPLMTTTSAFQYPDPVMPNSADDPFVAAAPRPVSVSAAA